MTLIQSADNLAVLLGQNTDDYDRKDERNTGLNVSLSTHKYSSLVSNI